MTISNELVDTLFNKKRYKDFRKLKYIQVNLKCLNINRIKVNKEFWDHIKYNKNKRHRSNNDIIRRLRLIKCSIKILENTFYVQDSYTISDGSRKIRFLFILGNIHNKRIGIVLRKVHNNTSFHLYSIIPDWKGYIPRIEQINTIITISKI